MGREIIRANYFSHLIPGRSGAVQTTAANKKARDRKESENSGSGGNKSKRGNKSTK